MADDDARSALWSSISTRLLSGSARCYAIGGEARRLEPFGEWRAFHGLDAASYQSRFDEMVAQGFRPVQVSGYGEGFYPA